MCKISTEELSNRVMYSWNSLNEETVSSETINKFKNRLDTHLSTLSHKNYADIRSDILIGYGRFLLSTNNNNNDFQVRIMHIPGWINSTGSAQCSSFSTRPQRQRILRSTNNFSQYPGHTIFCFFFLKKASH